MSALVIRADARQLPLPDASVDLIVTSPPYYGLRSYTDGGEHYAGQIGAEATPQEYIASLIECTREWMRVLKPSGSLFVNLGDKYSTHIGTTSGHVGVELGITDQRKAAKSRDARANRRTGIPEKSLMMLPERYRIAAVDELGLVARAVMIWSKPNGLPESVTDRVRRSHEDWVHLTKQPRYYSAVDEIREQHVRGPRPNELLGVPGGGFRIPDRNDQGRKPSEFNGLGRLPGSVWEIPTEPLTVPEHLGVDHFAAFPSEWPRRIILGWSPSGICTACGEGRRPVVDRRRRAHLDRTSSHRGPGAVGLNAVSSAKAGAWSSDGYSDVTMTGAPYTEHPGTASQREPNDPIKQQGTSWANPGGGIGNNPRNGPWREYHLDNWTPPATRPAVVLDPFGGTGTTALVAHTLGRVGISVDRSADYCRIARWRTTDPGQIAKAMRVEKPPTQLLGQMDLLAEVSA